MQWNGASQCELVGKSLETETTTWSEFPNRGKATVEQMMYSSWDIAHDRCNCYFSFWAISCPFTPLTAQKIKISKKKPWRYQHFTHVYLKIMTRWCTVPEIWYATDGRMDRQTDTWTNRLTDRQTDGQTDGWMYRQTDGKILWFKNLQSQYEKLLLIWNHGMKLVCN